MILLFGSRLPACLLPAARNFRGGQADRGGEGGERGEEKRRE